MRKNVAVLGSTGSIGTQTLEVIKNLNEHTNHQFEVLTLACGRNLNLLEKQIKRFKPQAVAIKNQQDIDQLREALGDDFRDLAVYSGKEGLRKVATWQGVGLVINGLVGAVGLESTLAAIEKDIDIALANKESMVIGGELINKVLANSKSNIIPVDSEHSAIFQCLQAGKPQEVDRIILTASGGATRDMDPDKLENASREAILKHPNWDMGQKITVDSATLVNKGLEVIEAHWLFEVPYEEIEVKIHPQSIIHSMVGFKDSSIIAQLGLPDMRIPIQYALTYPKRVRNFHPALDLAKVAKLTFKNVDHRRYPAFNTVVEAGRRGGTYPAVINAANEVLVAMFLEGEINFGQIAKVLGEISKEYEPGPVTELEDILEADKWGRKVVLSLTC